MYVKIDLADERYCDGCPCLTPTVGLNWWGAWCEVLEEAVGERGTGQVSEFLRPQACIDASAAIETRLNLGPWDIEEAE